MCVCVCVCVCVCMSFYMCIAIAFNLYSFGSPSRVLQANHVEAQCHLNVAFPLHVPYTSTNL